MMNNRISIFTGLPMNTLDKLALQRRSTSLTWLGHSRRAGLKPAE